MSFAKMNFWYLSLRGTEAFWNFALSHHQDLGVPSDIKWHWWAWSPRLWSLGLLPDSLDTWSSQECELLPGPCPGRPVPIAGVTCTFSLLSLRRTKHVSSACEALHCFGCTAQAFSGLLRHPYTSEALELEISCTSHHLKANKPVVTKRCDLEGMFWHLWVG